jgi:hypothetical protein
MARRTKKRSPITVEVCPYAEDERTAVARLDDAARRLLRYSPERVDRLVALAETYCAAWERQDESSEAFEARLRRIVGHAEGN